MMTAFRQPMTDIDLTLRILGPFADELKSGFYEHRPRCVLALRRRGIHFNGFALGASASRFRPPVITGLQKHVAYMLVADVEDLVDFGVRVVTCACAKPILSDFVVNPSMISAAGRGGFVGVKS